MEDLELVLTCPQGLEGLLRDEAASLGLQDAAEGLALVRGRAPLATAYRLCLWSRLANRVLLVMARFPVQGAADLYEGVRSVPWQDHLAADGSLAIECTGQAPGIRHTHFGAQKAKDAVVDVLRERCGERPTVERSRPDLRLHVRLHRGEAVLSLDLSGNSLHQRGYRLQQGAAPLKENLAAALLLRADWPRLARDGAALADPMCGVATLLVEAGLMAADVAPNLGREHWGFSGWLGHVPARWKPLLEDAGERARAGLAGRPSWIRGYEADPRLVQPARNNIERAGLSDWIKIYQGEVDSFAPRPDRGQSGLVITNPPYGQRMGEEAGLVALYRQLGSQLRSHCLGWQAAVFTGTPELGHQLGLRARKQYALRNGALPCKLLLFDVCEASFHGAVRAQGGAEADTIDAPLSEGARMFANRLEKNRRQLRRWLRDSGVTCYRLYDADMPEYAVAVDIYGDHVHVQEYAPPKSVDPARARGRLHDTLAAIPGVLGVPPEQIAVKRRERQGGRSQYQRQGEQGEFLEVEEGGVRLLVNLRDYLDTGLFLDHRPLRLRIRQEAAEKRFLNLFCYTATASVHAAAGGARSTTSVDLSNTYLDWAGRNLSLNGFTHGHERIQADVTQWLETHREQYDLVLLDPPTFSNSKRMEGVFDVQRDHARLIRLAMARVTPDGVLYFSNNFRRFELDPALVEAYAVEDITRATLDPDFQRRPDIHHAWRITHRRL